MKIPEKTDEGIARIKTLSDAGGGNLMKNEMNRSKIFNKECGIHD